MRGGGASGAAPTAPPGLYWQGVGPLGLRGGPVPGRQARAERRPFRTSAPAAATAVTRILSADHEPHGRCERRRNAAPGAVAGNGCDRALVIVARGDGAARCAAHAR